MPSILAIETSGDRCSLAIHTGERWFEDTQAVERLHNRVVLAQLDALVRRTGLRRHFDVVAFGAGPGSFTGIRIAAAVAQGVAFAFGAVVVPVSSSQALAASVAHDERTAEEIALLTVRRSRRDAYYLAGFELGRSEGPRRVMPDVLHQGVDAPDELTRAAWTGVGDCPPWWPSDRSFLSGVEVSARTVAALGLQGFASGKSVPPEAAFPVYVRGDSPWRPVSG
jgi:tRNA threonylcarbamoyladenosine biosynthesis protein TsaB